MMLPRSRDRSRSRYYLVVDIMARVRLDASAISIRTASLEETLCRVYVHIEGIRSLQGGSLPIER